MVRNVHLVFKDGAFRLMEPAQIVEGTRVTVAIQEPESQAEELSAGQKAYRILKQIAELPPEGERNPTPARDHDRVLYGKTR